MSLIRVYPSPKRYLTIWEQPSRPSLLFERGAPEWAEGSRNGNRNERPELAPGPQMRSRRPREETDGRRKKCRVQRAAQQMWETSPRLLPILTMDPVVDCWSDGIAEALTNATSSQTSSSGGKSSDAGALAVGWVATVVSLLALGLVQ